MLTGMPFGVSAGHVLPLGKVPNFDDIFEQLLINCKSAIRDSVLKIRPKPEFHQGVFFGMSPVPEGFPPPQAIFGLLHHIAQDEEIFRATLYGLDLEQLLCSNLLEDVALGGSALGTLNDDLILPQFKFHENSETNKSIRNLAAARLGALVRTALHCDLHGTIPLTSDQGYYAVTDRLRTRCGEVLLEVGQSEDNIRFARLERLVFSEYIPEATLDALSFEDVLKLRTKAWGRYSKGRGQLFAELHKIAADVDNDKEFDQWLQRELQRFKNTAADLQHEHSKLKIKVFAEAGGAVTAAIGSPELVEKLLGVDSLHTALLLGSLMLIRIKEYAPQIKDHLRAIEKQKAPFNSLVSR